MTTELATRPVNAETLEKVLLGGNLSVLTAQERMTYYTAVCESVGLNPLTRPFEYLNLNGKLVLYARREATEQLRKIHGVSIGKLEKVFRDDLYIVEAPATDKTGRTDSSTGAVSIKGLAGDNLANAVMKCETKAKRRVTLSICGLGMLDETEIDTIRGAVVIPPETVEVVDPPAVDDVPALDVHADIKGGETLFTGGSGGADDDREMVDFAEELFSEPVPSTPASFRPLKPEGLPTPEKDFFDGPITTTRPPQGIAPPEPTERKDYAFLREMKRQKDRLAKEMGKEKGEAMYYRVLGGAGYTHADEILDRETKIAVFKELSGRQVIT